MAVYAGFCDELPAVPREYNISRHESIDADTARTLIEQGVQSMISATRASWAAELESVHGIKLPLRRCPLFVQARPGDVMIVINQALLPGYKVSSTGRVLADNFLFFRRTVVDRQMR
jgi:hypothetical protein